MLIKFESKQAAPFVMQRSIAEQLLSMAGLPSGVEGSISGAAIPQALARLDKALSEREGPCGEAGEAGEEDDELEPVSLDARAAPLRAMLGHAMRCESYVMWRPD